MLQKAQLAIGVRWMVRADQPTVISIEHASFEHPWDEETITEHLRERDFIGMVAEYDESVIGYIVYHLRKDKFDVIRLAVHPDWRNMGVGTQLIQRLQGSLSAKRRNSIAMRVNEANLSAQLFLKGIGFRATRVERQFYKESGQDAYHMILPLSTIQLGNRLAQYEML